MEAELQSKIAKGENIGPGSSLMKNMASMLSQQIAALRLESLAYYGIPLNNRLWLDGEEGLDRKRLKQRQAVISIHVPRPSTVVLGRYRKTS